ncbi:hypothetical protein AC578_7254 [Pseudocercospora eumusae]|uniref:FCP1 homology domain-containing protein n=1 Tax=Pseudocercospora eumusae TaxID=321146 RepID=A0A139HX09_9PEZI|nr:hypothetical protein AC578_7254 [Pseudocercospora eumusae]
MNSLNIVSRLTATPPTTPPRSRTSSSAEIHTLGSNDDGGEGANGSASLSLSLHAGSLSEKLGHLSDHEMRHAADADAQSTADYVDEKTPLLSLSNGNGGAERHVAASSCSLPYRMGAALIYGVKVVVSTVTFPVRYVIACFYNEHGRFSALLPLTNFKNMLSRRKRRSDAHQLGLGAEFEKHEQEKTRPQQKRHSSRRSPSVDSNASTASYQTSDAEDSPARRTRSKTAASQQSEESLPRKSIRIREDALRKRKPSKAKSKQVSQDDIDRVASELKSPTSPAGAAKLTKYPRQPQVPRPLVPRRQPSYTGPPSSTPKKTLIIDLDETLIHSMAKGGRMSTGHMVEVRLAGPMTSSGVQIGTGVPILYFVHERPACHEFLRKVAKWFNLVVFTASVQEYADPVIDWVERERKYFSGRYYRQHCTYRNGAYIKDLAQVEPDLSKVMILDNSPMSYIFHEDNAIPIEGWISDPTDKELVTLIPFLEAIQYATDVRAVLALRQGQATQA